MSRIKAQVYMNLVTQQQVIDSVVDDFTAAPASLRDDVPAIRVALNDRMDHYKREGMLSRATADRWSLARMVRAVRRAL